MCVNTFQKVYATQTLVKMVEPASITEIYFTAVNVNQHIVARLVQIVCATVVLCVKCILIS